MSGGGSKSKSRIVIAKIYSMAGTGFFYSKRRPRTAPKLEMMKFDPIVGQHVLFTEKKITPPKL